MFLYSIRVTRDSNMATDTLMTFRCPICVYLVLGEKTTAGTLCGKRHDALTGYTTHAPPREGLVWVLMQYSPEPVVPTPWERVFFSCCCCL